MADRHLGALIRTATGQTPTWKMLLADALRFLAARLERAGRNLDGLPIIDQLDRERSAIAAIIRAKASDPLVKDSTSVGIALLAVAAGIEDRKGKLK